MIDYSSNILSDKNKKEGYAGFEIGDMFDRIINLKLTSAYYKDNNAVKKDEYVIRSDWEMYYPQIGKVVTGEAKGSELSQYYIRRCVHKPSIKVQYKQISTGTAIEIDIFVSNFIMMSADGRAFMSFSRDYPLQQVELQMGYFSQFKDKPADAEEFFDFSPKPNVDTLCINIAYVQTDKLPPDGVLHIHGYVGSCYNPPLSSLKGEDYKETYTNRSDIKQYYGDYLKDYIFINVTRRFLRKVVSDEDVSVDKDTGLMKIEDALKYGVKVFLSDTLEKACRELLERKKVKDEKGKVVDKPRVIGFYSESVVQAMNRFREEFGVDISIKALIDGNYIAYLSDEAVNSQALSETLKKYKYEDTDLVQAGSVIENIYHNVLPAVENITADALCTIVCPFFYFLNPFDMIKFKSRYALGGVVSYYANFTAVESKFWALYMSVSFATVDDINECTIVCTGEV